MAWCEAHQAEKYRIFAWCKKARPIGNTLSGERCRFIQRSCEHGELEQHEIVLFTDYQGKPHFDPFVVCPGPMEEVERERG